MPSQVVLLDAFLSLQKFSMLDQPFAKTVLGRVSMDRLYAVAISRASIISKWKGFIRKGIRAIWRFHPPIPLDRVQGAVWYMVPSDEYTEYRSKRQIRMGTIVFWRHERVGSSPFTTRARDFCMNTLIDLSHLSSHLEQATRRWLQSHMDP